MGDQEEYEEAVSILPSTSTQDLLCALPTQPRSAHMRAASSGDYFSLQPSYTQRKLGSHTRRISPLASSSSCSSSSSSSSDSSSFSSPSTADSSPRVRSPLAHEIQFRHNPAVTFDSFLAPHKSGKGEAFCGAVNARPGGLRSVRKVPSMPLLRRRGEFV